MTRWTLLLGALAAALASCGGQADQEMPVAEPTPFAIPEPSKPPHRYDLKDGSDYAYIAGVSEEERKAGKAAGDVLMFRYLGKQDGLHTLAMLSDSGKIIGKSACAEPCVIIKNNDGSRTAYTPESVIGSAFQDALNGYLEEAAGGGKATANEDPRPAADQVASIPAAFRGEWNGDLSACGTGLSDTRLRVSEKKLQFYESDAEVKSAKIISSRAIEISALFTGEGETWNSELKLALSRSGNDLTIQMGGDDFTRIKCPTT